MATTSVTIRMDENLKKEAEALFAEMGLNMTTAITLFTKAVVNQQKIPFEITAPKPNNETAKTIREVNKGLNLSPKFHSVKSLMEELNA